MLTRDEAMDLIDQVFKEEALALGGMVAIQEVADDVVWRLIRNMDVIRRRVRRRLEANDPEVPNPNQAHPAIQRFLSSLGAEQ